MITIHQNKREKQEFYPLYAQCSLCRSRRRFLAVWKHQRLILQASCSTSNLSQEITAMEVSFTLGMELSSTTATNGVTSYVREAVECILGFDLRVDGDGGAHRIHSTLLQPLLLSSPPPPPSTCKLIASLSL